MTIPATLPATGVAPTDAGTTPTPSAFVRSAGDDERRILLDLRSGTYLSLNAVAARCWRHLEEGSPIERTIEQIASELGVDRRRVSTDVARLVDDLAGRGLVTTTRAPFRGPAPPEPPASPLPVRGKPPRVSLRRLLPAWLLLVRLDLECRRFGFQRLLAALPPLPPGDGACTSATIIEVVGSVDRAAALYLRRTRCLHRSVACARLLRRRGVPARLVLGVRALPFFAHAWVEVADHTINDGEWISTLDVLGRF